LKERADLTPERLRQGSEQGTVQESDVVARACSMLGTRSWKGKVGGRRDM
jgi:hypothetical protein